jgi:molybdenum cofactor cytidylyltransferase
MPIVPENIGIIILAAGASTRMGEPKQLLPIRDQTLLAKVLKTALGSSAKYVITVLGANENILRDAIEWHSVGIVNNTTWEKGIGSSIKAGVQSLMSSVSNLNGVILVVCDQPLLTSQHLTKLIEASEQAQEKIIASAYANTLGAPVCFPKKYFQHLLTLEDHEGAKKIIQQFSNEVTSIDFPGGEIDLDTMDDYRAFTKDQNP